MFAVPPARVPRLLLLLVLAAGCTGPRPVAPPPTPAGVSLEGRDVVWTSGVPSRGAVRYGRYAGRYDHVAYPASASRADLAFSTDHRVRLLGVAALDSVYLELVDQLPTGVDVVSAEYAFRVGAPAPAGLLTWTMIDVGFGDSHLLTMPGTGRRVLIDAGERRDAPNVERFLEEAGVTRLDDVLITHIHEDHIGGLVGSWNDPDDGVLGTIETGTLIDAPNHSASRGAFDELVALAARRAIPRVTVATGATDATDPVLAWDPSVRVAVLHAGGGRALGGESESDWINDDSIVLRLTYGAVSVVMGGDAEAPVEALLIASQADLGATVLKVHHHGSANASEPAYLAAVDPRVGLIPITKFESFGGSLPSGIVLDRLHSRGVDVYASDRGEPLGLAAIADEGWNVTVHTDGASVDVMMTRSSSVHYPPDESALAGSRGARP